MEENKILQEQIENASPEIKNFLKERKWSSVTEEIAKKNNFVNEQLNSFENEILFVLLGMELSKDFPQNLRLNVGLTEKMAADISQEAYEKIFKGVEQFLPVDTEGVSETENKQETKEEAMQRLKNRMSGESVKGLEIVPKNLPMVENGEVVHDVPHLDPVNPAPIAPVPNAPEIKPEPANPKIDQPKPISTPHYPGGKDPYREPLV